MVKIKLIKGITYSLITTSLLMINPIGANASWKQNNIGWWYTNDNSWVTGWNKINGKWYYFYSDGYMANNTSIDGYILDSNGAWINNEPTASNTSSNEKIVDITVGTAQEFVNAIGSNKRIILKPGVYNLSDINQINNSDNSVSWVTVEDGKELNIKGIHNLTIEGMDSGKVEIKVSPRYANIVNFTNVNNITIKNIVAGHTPSPYECNAGVLKFTASNDISIINSELYGCGSIGINLYSVKNLEVSNSTIDHCSLRAVQISNSEAIKFTESKLVNHEAFSNIIMVNSSKNIVFEKCEMTNNNNFGWSYIEALDKSNILLDKCVIKNNSQAVNSDMKFDKTYFFNTVDYTGISNSTITIKDSYISNNKCDYFTDNKESIKFENCTINNNDWK
ncbi:MULTISPECIES: right-handed parallel beta-helix repeat-containing protein [unclassified Clostridium]|uniref:right-handed parallel beta-helix repeat-containing protein n=1 Tax=unclassified Clostridium TaxID=2614128 RepID=UPI00029812A1|nr:MULTISPECIES: right-handed parallel beta-helix repeat-containing protein [unclassified Clostridium]EKQ51502.1 MAG: putative cell wall binding protein [Clostridium sp. Maddingley MBC34-26]